MLTLDEVLDIGKNYFAKNDEQIAQVNETEHFYILFGANKNKDVKYGRSDIKINKKTGEITIFRLPSMENFKLLENSVRIDF